VALGRYEELTDRLSLDSVKRSRFWGGIPFAQPPLGALRFKPPQPFTGTWLRHSDKNGQRDATNHPPPCPQTSTEPAFLSKQSEDCLYLNIYVPASSRTPTGTKFPVMIWIYGGSFNSGDSSFMGIYDASRLVDAKDVIVVTFNYRVDVLGFFSSGEPDAHLNIGIEDQRAAIDWVKANIADFHGDPDNITLFGQSAGAVSIIAHLTSPKTPKGLFHRAILQSAPLGVKMPSPAEILTVSSGLAKALNCLTPQRKIDMVCMRSKSASEIISTSTSQLTQLQNNDASAMIQSSQTNLAPQIRSIHDLMFWASVDGTWITAQLRDLMRQGRTFDSVPLLIGYNKNEVAYLMQDYDIPIKGTFQIPKHFSKTAYTDTIHHLFGNFSTSILGLYPAQGSDMANMHSTEAVLTSVFFTCSVFEVIHQAAKKPNPAAPVYTYEFDAAGFPPYGYCVHQVCHGAELPYVFPSLWSAISDVKSTLSHQMMTFWANFATTGNPNLAAKGGTTDKSLQVQWPAYDKTGQSMMYFDSPKVHVGRPPDQSKVCKLWRQLFELET